MSVEGDDISPETQGVEGTAQGLLRGQAEPALQDGGIDAAEVHRHLQVAVDQVGEARVGPVQPRPDAWAGQEDRPGRAVVGPHRAVLRDAAAELAEDQHQDPVGQPRRRQVIEERPERRRELLQQRGVARELVAVGVVAALLEVVDARAQPGLDQPRRQLQPTGQLRLGIRCVAAGSGDGLQAVRGGVGVQQAAAEELPQVVTGGRRSRSARTRPPCRSGHSRRAGRARR